MSAKFHNCLNLNEEDSLAEEVEKVEHYLESPEKEPAHKVEVETEVMHQTLVPENNQQSHAAVCKLQLQSNVEMENTIMEEKIIEVIAYIYRKSSIRSRPLIQVSSIRGRKI